MRIEKIKGLSDLLGKYPFFNRFVLAPKFPGSKAIGLDFIKINQYVGREMIKEGDSPESKHIECLVNAAFAKGDIK